MVKVNYQARNVPLPPLPTVCCPKWTNRPQKKNDFKPCQDKVDNLSENPIHKKALGLHLQPIWMCEQSLPPTRAFVFIMNEALPKSVLCCIKNGVSL